MGLFGQMVSKGIATAAKNSTIRAIGDAASNAISSLPEKDIVAIQGGSLFIKPTRSSEEYHGEKVLEIAKELLGAGFESVSLQPVYSLGKFSKSNFGKIESISINGKKDFKGIKKVPSSSYIVINYYDFKSNVDQKITSSVRYHIPSVMRRGDELRKDNKAFVCSPNSSVATGAKYCPFCGSAIENKNANFCSNCGEKFR